LTGDIGAMRICGRAGKHAEFDEVENQKSASDGAYYDAGYIAAGEVVGTDGAAAASAGGA
jgi:hypothetical protein